MNQEELQYMDREKECKGTIYMLVYRNYCQLPPSSSLEIVDLEQEAKEVLLKCIRNYVPGRSQFNTYLRSSIRNRFHRIKEKEWLNHNRGPQLTNQDLTNIDTDKKVIQRL